MSSNLYMRVSSRAVSRRREASDNEPSGVEASGTETSGVEAGDVETHDVETDDIWLRAWYWGCAFLTFLILLLGLHEDSSPLM